MIYLKSYCYSEHEIPFIISNLEESEGVVDKLYLYEYNYTHTGVKKEYCIEKHIDKIPKHLRERLVYKKVNLDTYIEYAYENEGIIHSVNEPIQRSWFFNDEDLKLEEDDIIIDIDIDEIIYKDCYKKLLTELEFRNQPFSIKLNQFFFRANYLWQSCNFSSPSIYKFGMVSNINKSIKGLKILNQRDLACKSLDIYGCHMSWIMPVDYMIKKLHSYSHPKYRIYADKDVLKKAIDNKEYVFDRNKNFDILELDGKDSRIPIYFQDKLEENILFNYL